MTIVSKPDMSYGVWAEGGNIEIPSSEKVNEGWAVEKPLNEWMNWLQNRQDSMLQYLNQRGMPEWDSRTEYPVDAFAVKEGIIYQAISQNKDADPTLNPDIWNQPFATSTNLASLNEDIRKIKEVSGYLPHYVQIDYPVMTGVCKGFAYFESTGKSGYSFAATTPSIVKDGKLIAQFTGGTAAKDIVTHEQLSQKLQGYQVGDIYITTGSGTPEERLGYGKWERFGQGKALVGFNDSVGDELPTWTKTVGNTFGSYDHTLTTDEMPSHKHPSNLRIQAANKVAFDTSLVYDGISGGDYIDHEYGNQRTTSDTQYSGGGSSHNNTQPSIVVFLWKRVA